MAGFHQPLQHTTAPLASAAHRAGLSLRQRDGRLSLSRFGHCVHLRLDQGQWWVSTSSTSQEKAFGPFTDEAALMRAAAKLLDAVGARSCESLVRGR